MNLRSTNPLLVRVSLLLIGTAGVVGACGDSDPTQKHPSKGGSSGEPGGEAGDGGTSSGTGGSRGGAAGDAGDSGSGSGGEGASVTGGASGTNGNGGAGRGGSAGSGATGGTMGGTAGNATGGASPGGEGGIGAEGGVGGEGGDGPRCESDDPTVLAYAPKAWGLAVKDGHVYFTTHELDGVVARMTTEGTTLQLIATGQKYPHQVAASGELAFWAALGAEAGHLFQSAVTGANRREIATGELNGIFSLVADEAHAYFVTEINRVVSVPFGGGASTDVEGGPFNSFIVDMTLEGQDLLWVNTGVAIFAPTQPGTAVIFSANPHESTVSQLVTRLDYPQFQITANETNVFWSDESALYRTARIGGTATSIASLPAKPPDESPIVDMVSDDDFVFYTDGTKLYRVPTAGGTTEIVTDGWERITQLGIDETSVYFTDSLRGTVVKVKKCASDSAVASPATAAASDAGAADEESWTVEGTTCSSTPGPHGCPEPTVVAPLPRAWGLALDDENLYASSFGVPGSVVRIPLAGGDPVPLATAQDNPHDLTIDDENVYFCLHYNNAPGKLVKVPKQGGVSELLALGAFNYGVGRPISDGTFVYYITAFSGVFRVAASGGTPTNIASGPHGSNAVDLVEDDGEIFWVNDGIWNSNFTAKLPGTAYIGRSVVSGSPNLGRTTLKSGLDYPVYRLTNDATNVYFIDDTTLYKTSRTGGATVELGSIAPASGTIVDMHTDGQHLYYADFHGVYRMSVNGGAVETLSSGWADLRSIAVDGTDLYFTDFGSGAVLKRPK